MQTTYYENKKITKTYFIADTCFDYYSERLRADDYRGNVYFFAEWLEEEAEINGFHKIIVKSKKDDIDAWQELGYINEGEFKGYFNGATAYAMCKYLKNERRNSEYWIEEDRILKDVLKLEKGTKNQPLQIEYTLRMADVQDAKSLAELYGNVFQVYPTPMNDIEYVREMIESGTLFCIIEHEGRIVSAASADVNDTYNNAEITDCATTPEHRKFGLMKHLVDQLEKELFQRKIYCSYSIARALSFGMNAVFHQKDYLFKGRLANNCKIFDKYEDMNIWVKDLSK
ncbi:putative beta-lysine N-acetyltransferase [Fictibacillus phosphorivorans]|uniref:putative beta-lysine N-acetyltransferase n=1 Tax=Fictibacillus phosphorivorans TaxID=1221500 RepID=UPI001293BDED|nr:putative beta-lysine N-acetyltransferase [Fictibacillus phosphorivorans]MQR96377.1 putative beta-lysine N-acetyltransferase [Fictibacillus phosphorivorans]